MLNGHLLKKGQLTCTLLAISSHWLPVLALVQEPSNKEPRERKGSRSSAPDATSNAIYRLGAKVYWASKHFGARLAHARSGWVCLLHLEALSQEYLGPLLAPHQPYDSSCKGGWGT